MDTSASGSARVEVLDAAGLPVPGFELRNSRTIIANDVDHAVSWNSGADLSRIQGPVSLRVELRNAHLYAFQFGAETA